MRERLAEVIARGDTVIGDFVLPSLEVAGPGMHWVEVSRAIAGAWPPSDTWLVTADGGTASPSVGGARLEVHDPHRPRVRVYGSGSLPFRT